MARIVGRAATAPDMRLLDKSSRETTLADWNAIPAVDLYLDELSILCDYNNVDYSEVIRLANKHPRVNILNPGIGVGGHCIPIDPWFLVENYNKDFSIIRNARRVNVDKSLYISKKINSAIRKIKFNKERNSILFLGLTYKPNVTDLRESPSIKIINHLMPPPFCT